MEQCGEYQLMGPLGKGAFGEVRLAYHPKTDQKVAIKLIPLEDFPKEAAEAEARTHTLVSNHPAIPKLYANFESDDHKYYCLVMEYIEGIEFRKFLDREERLPEPECRNIFKQIVSVIAHLHSQDVAHRDLKCENLLYNEQTKKITIIDFGGSTSGYIEKESKAFSITPLYCAPEEILRNSDVSTAADMWSLGVVLFSMVEGGFPWGAGCLVSQIENSLVGKISTPTRASEQCKDIIFSLLQLDPAKRPTAASLLSHPWINGNLSTITVPIRPIPGPSVGKTVVRSNSGSPRKGRKLSLIPEE